MTCQSMASWKKQECGHFVPLHRSSTVFEQVEEIFGGKGKVRKRKKRGTEGKRIHTPLIMTQGMVLEIKGNYA